MGLDEIGSEKFLNKGLQKARLSADLSRFFLRRKLLPRSRNRDQPAGDLDTHQFQAGHRFIDLPAKRLVQP